MRKVLKSGERPVADTLASGGMSPTPSSAFRRSGGTQFCELRLTSSDSASYIFCPRTFSNATGSARPIEKYSPEAGSSTAE